MSEIGGSSVKRKSKSATVSNEDYGLSVKKRDNLVAFGRQCGCLDRIVLVNYKRLPSERMTRVKCTDNVHPNKCSDDHPGISGNPLVQAERRRYLKSKDIVEMSR